MNNDQYWMLGACVWALCISVSGISGLIYHRQKRLIPVWAAMLVLLILQTWPLLERGNLGQTCPIRGRAEVLFFLGWALNVFYLVLGRAYRISVIGVFTAPAIAVLSLLAVFFYSPAIISMADQHWLSWHIGLAMLGYGALGLAAMAAIAFFIQNSLMKAKKLSEVGRKLPPVRTLQSSMIRLIDCGFLLLAIAQLCGWVALDDWMPVMKGWVAAMVTVGYFVLILVTYIRGLPGRVLALWSLVLYAVSLSIFFFLS